MFLFLLPFSFNCLILNPCISLFTPSPSFPLISSPFIIFLFCLPSGLLFCTLMSLSHYLFLFSHCQLAAEILQAPQASVPPHPQNLGEQLLWRSAAEPGDPGATHPTLCREVCRLHRTHRWVICFHAFLPLSSVVVVPFSFLSFLCLGVQVQPGTLWCFVTLSRYSWFVLTCKRFVVVRCRYASHVVPN